MREVLTELLEWWRTGATIGVGTVVATWRSAPRPAGASMLVGPDGQAVGSVSGGCVEGAVYELGQQVMADGTPVLQRYGVSDDDAFAIGLTCGGILDVFVEPVNRETFPQLATVAAEIEAGRPVAVATVIEHPNPGTLGRRLVIHPEEDAEGTSPTRDGSPLGAHGAEAAGSAHLAEAAGSAQGAEAAGSAHGAEAAGSAHLAEAAGGADGSVAAGAAGPATGTLGSERMDAAVADDARGLLASGRTETLTYGPDGERRGEGMRVFVASYAPRPRMIVFGAIDFAASVAQVGTFLGYRVTVCDARPVFATASRFPDADEVVVDWPHRYLAAERDGGRLDQRTVVCVLTHDPKFDVPVLEVALRTPLAYIGAMGSRRTHDDRLARLREAGLSDDELAHLSSPIGLDLGARTPQETAVSIAAEIIALHWGGGGSRLADRDGPIHHSAD